MLKLNEKIKLYSVQISDTNTKNTITQDDEQWQAVWKEEPRNMEYQSQKKRPQQVGTLMSLLRPCKFLPGRPTYLKLPLANNNSANKNSENTLDMIGYLEHLRADRKRRR